MTNWKASETMGTMRTILCSRQRRRLGTLGRAGVGILGFLGSLAGCTEVVVSEQTNKPDAGRDGGSDMKDGGVTPVPLSWRWESPQPQGNNLRALWGVADPRQLAWLDPPPDAAISEARTRLTALEAIDANGRPTGHGRTIARLPLPPRLGHMLVRAGEQGLALLVAHAPEDPLRWGIVNNLGLSLNSVGEFERDGLRQPHDAVLGRDVCSLEGRGDEPVSRRDVDDASGVA